MDPNRSSECLGSVTTYRKRGYYLRLVHWSVLHVNNSENMVLSLSWYALYMAFDRIFLLWAYIVQL